MKVTYIYDASVGRNERNAISLGEKDQRRNQWPIKEEDKQLMCSKCDDFWCELDENGEHFDNYPPEDNEGGWGCLFLSCIGLLIVLLI